MSERNSPLSRTISVESIGPKISQLFKRKRKRDVDESSTPVDSHESDSDEAHHVELSKRRKISKTAEQIAFDANEVKLDLELPEEFRRFRPRGFRFNIPPTDRPIRIYADGVFDLFHLGHMKQLEQAKKSFANVELVCGVPSDIETHKRKGLTVLTDQQRCDTLTHCKWVDEVIPNAPWCVTADFLLAHKIDYVAHDDLPYASTDSDDIYKPIKERGMFLTTQRTEGISTSDIITKIIRDYDKYLMRNFARGATRKELNVSWLKKNELEFKKHINDFRTYWKRNQMNLNNVSKDLYFEVREYMRGKKFDVQSFLENSSVNSTGSDDDLQSRASSPLTEFASKYIGNANKELNGPPRSIFANVKEWMNKIDDEDDEDTDGEVRAKLVPVSKSGKVKEEKVTTPLLEPIVSDPPTPKRSKRRR